MEPRHDLRVVRDKPDVTPVARAREPALGLSWIDRMAATALLDAPGSELAAFLELVRGCADSLASEDATGSRRRLLARQVAISKAILDTTTAMIGQRVRLNDERGAVLADRLATSAAKRLAILVESHRAETAMEMRAAFVAIGHADHVVVEAEK